MGFGWQSDAYNKFSGNSHFATDAAPPNMHGMMNHLDVKPK
jgi:hypothetical protein